MRRKEYFELANRSLKIRKKSNRATVLGLAMGFALIVPIIVALFGVNVSLTNQLNEIPYTTYYEIAMSDYRVDTQDYLDTSTLNTANVKKHVSGSCNIDYLTNNENIPRAIVYEQYVINNFTVDSVFSMSVNNGVFASVSGRDDSNYSIIDIEKSDSLFPTNLTANYDGGIFVEGCSQGFTDNGKKQIIVSESFLLNNGLKAIDIYLKPISIRASQSLRLDDSGETIPTDGFLCMDYTVVGVIKSSVSDIYDKRSSDLMSSDLFFTSVNVYDANGAPVLKPNYHRYGNKTYEEYLQYDNFVNKDSLNQEYMMLGWNDGGLNKSAKNNMYTFGNTCVYGESNNYAQLNKSLSNTNSYFTNKVGYKDDYAVASQTFHNYNMVYDLTNIVSLIILVISIVLGMGALINMFCAISHSVSERRQYLTMMRAIGAKDKDIPRLYMLESAILSAKASVLVIVIGFILSTAVKLGFDAILKNHGVVYQLSVPWWTIFVTIIAVVVMIFAVGILFSYLCSKRLSKDKISETLNNG